MKMPVVSRILFAIVSILQALGAHLADFGPTHIFNPLWPPHAKFHTGQTLSFSIMLAVMTIYFSNRKTADKTFAVFAATSTAASYWVTQACASFYPGTAFADPNFASNAGFSMMGIPTQLWIDTAFLTLIAIATWVALKPDAKWTSDESRIGNAHI